MKKDFFDTENKILQQQLNSPTDSILDILTQVETDYNTKYLEILEKYELYQSEHNRNHNGYYVEKLLLDLVREGNVDGVKEFMLNPQNSVGLNEIGVVASDNSKTMEYYGVTAITLLSRAAVDGCVPLELSYEFSDILLQELSKASTLEEQSIVIIKAELIFALLVREERLKKTHPYINDCKNFISSHLRKPFKVSEIGPAIGVNTSYLSKKFTEEEGITIIQYINRERCRHAANLLKYSDYEISQIAEYFCFSSQSHFGSQFKLYYNMSPGEYRRRYHFDGLYNEF